MLTNVQKCISGLLPFISTLQPEITEAPRKLKKAGPGKPAVLPEAALWVAMLLCVLKRSPSQKAVWRTLTAQWAEFGLDHFDLSPQAIYQRLARTKPKAMEKLFSQVTALLLKLYPNCPGGLAGVASFASDIIALDQTTLDPVLRKTKLLRWLCKGHDGLLPGALNCIFDIRRQLWRTIKYIQDAKENEKKQARACVEGLKPGTLILADMGYFSFAWFDYLALSGHWFISRVREKTTCVPKDILFDGWSNDVQVTDRIVHMGAYRADMMACPVRLVEITIQSNTGSDRTEVHRYITNVLDPVQLSVHDIIKLYRRRWDIERAFNLVKTDLGLHMLCSSKPNTILTQVFATFTIAQIVLAMRLEIARQTGAEVQEVSLNLLVREIPRFIAEGKDPVEEFVLHGRKMEWIRPYRSKQYTLPDIDLTRYHVPETVTLWRKPRYAGRKNGPRPRTPT